jgi:hypothetical protein
MENVQINPLDYGYTDDQSILIPANHLLSLMFFAQKVKESQPELFLPYEFPKEVNNTYDKEGVLTDSDVEWKEYEGKEAEVFFKNVNKPVRGATELSLLADQVLFAMGTIHEQNINNGVAKNLKDEQENSKLSQLLAEQS